ncbi:MAG TPA: VTT domain-containing protein [Kofleriaceae bacterium]|nr:VTT domain-containing protein [Kofleriaceae bacterium]
MNDAIYATFGIYLGTFLFCFGSGLVPIFNAELFLVAVSSMWVSSVAPLPAIVLLAAAGQMTAKIFLYYGARSTLERATGRRKEKIEKARAKLDKWRQRPNWYLLVSSTIGLPPFFIISLLAGALKIRLRRFLLIGTIGRVVRFAVLVALPWLPISLPSMPWH